MHIQATKSLIGLAMMIGTVGAVWAKDSVFELAGFPAKVYYGAETALEKGSPCELAVVMIHGWGSGVEPSGNGGVIRAGAAAHGVKKPYVVQPMFPRRTVLKKNKVAADGRAVWNDSWDGKNALKLAADDWRGGGDAVGQSFSSFDVVDRIFSVFADAKRYPSLKRVVLTGFSAGGQFVCRYVAVGKGAVRPGVTLDYVAMSPSTEFRFEPETKWHYGLKGRPRYSAGLPNEQIMSNLSARRVWWGCGEKDVTSRSLDVAPEAMAQGANRLLRFRGFREHVKKFPAWEKQLSFREIPAIGHESSKAYADSELRTFLLGLNTVTSK